MPLAISRQKVVRRLFTERSQGSGSLTVSVTEMSEQAYAEFVAGRFDEAARGGEAIVFSNRGTSHARAVLGQMISRARVSLDIFSGSLSARVYDAALLKSAALNLRGEIRIILGEARPFSEASAVDLLQEEFLNGTIKVRCVRSHTSIGGGARHIDHFAISDHKHIRSEDDAIDRSATIILNATQGSPAKLTGVLDGIFERMWNEAVPVSAQVSGV